MIRLEDRIFRQSSKTYFWSSLFFPPATRSEVAKLYSFVRLVDNFIDTIPAQTEKLNQVRHLVSTNQSTSHHPDPIISRVVQNYRHVAHKYNFNPEWTNSFLQAMESDINHQPMPTIDQSLAYVYGSAEVIGLMMSRLMSLPAEADLSAQMLGRAMQWINFIRDIDEDLHLQRQYFPTEDLHAFGLSSLEKSHTDQHPHQFKQFIDFQIQRYRAWQQQAEQGYKYIPRRSRVAIETAAQLYQWTADSISLNPSIVYQQKIKPSTLQVIKTGARNAILP